MNRKKHWETVYETKAPTEFSWYQLHPSKSLQLIKETAADRKASIIDVGGGASTLVDHLLEVGFANLTVFDLSAKALATSKQRLGKQAERVNWVEGDVTNALLPEASYDIWHDRAAFHFLTDEQDREQYRKGLARALRPKGSLIVATFASDGPERCSGLDVVRYSVKSLQQEFGDDFQLMDSAEEKHQTPFGKEQKFIYCCFKRTN